jgi:hypothetical protein
MLGLKRLQVNELIDEDSEPCLARRINSRRTPSPTDTISTVVLPLVREFDPARRCAMVTKRQWLAKLTAGLSIALSGVCGCQTNYGGMTLPSPRYLEHYPQYFPPDSSHPLPRELASMEDPDGAARRAGAGGAGVAPLAPPGAPVPVGNP